MPRLRRGRLYVETPPPDRPGTVSDRRFLLLRDPLYPRRRRQEIRAGDTCPVGWFRGAGDSDGGGGDS